MAGHHKFNFNIRHDPTKDFFVKKYSNPDTESSVKKRLDCGCDGDCLTYEINWLDESDFKLDVSVKCLTCNKKVTFTEEA